jgi:hypothetical protein
MTEWLANKRTKVLALHLACDLLEHLKEHTVPIWPIFMTPLFDALGDVDTEARIGAAYAVNNAASIPQFAEAAPEAFNRLAMIVSGPAPKKRDEQGKMASDNAVAALLALARHASAQCPPDVPAWSLVVDKLPIQDDYEEGRGGVNVPRDLVLDQHGRDAQENL